MAYVSQNRPVFSSRQFNGFHFTLVGKTRTVVGGLKAVCPNGCDEQQIDSGSNSAKLDKKRARIWRFSCNQCNFIAYETLRKGDVPAAYQGVIMDVPGAEFLRTQFPIPKRALAWRKKINPPNGANSVSRAPSISSAGSSATLQPAATSVPPKPATTSVPPKPATTSVPPKPATTSVPPKPAVASVPRKPAATSIPPRPAATQVRSQPPATSATRQRVEASTPQQQAVSSAPSRLAVPPVPERRPVIIIPPRQPGSSTTRPDANLRDAVERLDPLLMVQDTSTYRLAVLSGQEG